MSTLDDLTITNTTNTTCLDAAENVRWGPGVLQENVETEAAKVKIATDEAAEIARDAQTDLDEALPYIDIDVVTVSSTSFNSNPSSFRSWGGLRDKTFKFALRI